MAKSCIFNVLYLKKVTILEFQTAQSQPFLDRKETNNPLVTLLVSRH